MSDFGYRYPDDETDASDTLDASQDGSELAKTLASIKQFGKRYVAFPSDAAATAWVLWVAHCYVIDHLDSTPRLAIISAEKQSGKTRLLEITATLVPRPLRSANVSTAALFREIGSEARPTVLLDEADATWAGQGANEELRALLNAGHRRGDDVVRMVGKGVEMKSQRFATFAAVALAGIGDLPDTLMDRSVVLRMRRRAPHEQVERWRFRQGAPLGHDLRDQLQAELGSIAELPLPEDHEEISDRTMDVWEPLLSIALVAGGQWPALAMRACRELSKTSPSAMSLNVRLLSDIRAVWPEGEAFLPTADLLQRLHSLEEAPWAPEGVLGPDGLTARRLAWKLKAYEVSSSHSVARDRRGYYKAALTDAWSRYLEPLELPEGTSDPSNPYLQAPSENARGSSQTDRIHLVRDVDQPETD